MIESIALFFIIVLGLGSMTNLFGWSKEDALERQFISSGVGLLAIPVIGAVFNFLHIPIDYKNFLVVTSAILLINIALSFRRKKAFDSIVSQLKQIFTPVNIGVLTIFGLALFMYFKGTFSYEYFEDHDPWHIATVAKYIALHKTYNHSFIFSYVALPYPQGYQTIFGILNQVNPSINWTMKFFNVLIVSLSIPYFYFLANKIFPRKRSAFFAMTTLFAMPAWLTHFIFPFGLNMVFLVLFFYIVEKIQKNKRWQWLGVLALASIWLTHFYSAFVISLMFLLYYTTKVYCEGDINKPLIHVGTLGILLSIYVFWLPSLFLFKDRVFDRKVTIQGLYIIDILRKLLLSNLWGSVFLVSLVIFLVLYFTDKKWLPFVKNILEKIRVKYLKPKIFILFLLALLALLLIPKKLMMLHGSASMPYTLDHFILFKIKRNLIQNPFGIGPLPAVLGLVSIAYCFVNVKRLFSRENWHIAAIFILSIFTFLGVNSARFSLNIMPFRMWSFFAFSVALLCGLCYDMFIVKRIEKPFLNIIITTLLIAALIPTWYSVKYRLNSHAWKENYLFIEQSRQLYSWIKNNIPKNSKVFSLAMHQCVPISFDMVSDAWDKEVYYYTEIDIELSPTDNYNFLKSKGYEYIVLDVSFLFYRDNYANKSLAPHIYEGDRKKFFEKHMKMLFVKIEIMKNQPDRFKLVKEFESSGAIFKVL